MISMRYHVVSLLAAFLALAVGVVLGAGPLRADASAPAAGATQGPTLAAAQSRIEQLDQVRAFADAYAAATAKPLVAGALTGRAVTLVRLPGAEDITLAQVGDMVEKAGGSVTARVVVDQKLLDVGNRQLVGELAAQMQDSAKRAVAVPAGVSGYERMGLLLAHAVVSRKKAGESVDPAGDSILAGAATAGLVTTAGNIDRRGSLVVAVAGEPYGSTDQREGAGAVTATLLAALDGASRGSVLVGPVSSAAQDGLVGALRADPTAAKEVSTVDVGGQVAGAVVAVLALREQAAGGYGHYGSSAAADGPVPESP